jgi:enoyl-CoA hydratase
MSSPEIHTDIRNRIAYLTLHRPEALNAINLPMLHTMRRCFDEWAHDPNVIAVVSLGAGEKAYSAGGDIRGLYGSVTGAGPRIHDEFFNVEYTLNYQMHRFMKATGKPYIALIDGIVMGGGMGISQGATLRIAGPRTKMAMPETRIGLFPDVGGTYFLSRARGAIGLYLGLTSNVITGADATHVGLADCYQTPEQRAEMLAKLDQQKWSAAPLGEVLAVVKAHTAEAPPAPIAAYERAIEHHFTQKPDVAAIIASLRAESRDTLQEWATETAGDLEKRSPTMLEVTKRQIESGSSVSIADALRRERSMMQAAFEHPDVAEGIRALAIDKDHSPKWQPRSLADVSAESVDRFFEPRWTADAHPLAHLEQHFG